MHRTENEWRLTDEDQKQLGRFDMVVASVPAAQTAEMLTTVPTIAKQAAKAELSGCWALMMAVRGSLQLELDAAFVHESPISWIARNNSKPQRTDQLETWVIHASSEWSQQNLEIDNDQAAVELLNEFWKATGLSPRETVIQTAHRWRYALPTIPLEQRCLSDNEMQAFACGDWCGGPRVEGAFLSGMATAGRVLGLLNELQPPKRVATPVQRQLF